MSPPQARKRTAARRLTVAIYLAGGFYALGFVPGHYLHTPVWSIVAAAMAAIPLGIKLGRPVRACVICGLLGAVAGAGVAVALVGTAPVAPEARSAFCLKYVAAIGGFCAAVGALFGYMALQRHRQAQQELDEGE